MAGSTARSRTASPGRVVTFAQCTWWIRYTYQEPGEENIERFRGVGPRYAWLAGSPAMYASVSTIRPARHP